MTTLRSPCGRHLLRSVATFFSSFVFGAVIAMAASTDIANEPLITMADVAAKPNIMFILDDSGSMEREYMPDNMSDSGRYGYYSPQCNGVAYNPNIVYNPPLDSTGAAYANSSFSAAWPDGYTQASTDNLGTDNDYLLVGTSSAVTMGTGAKTFLITSSSPALTSSTFSVGQTLVFKTSTSATTQMTGTVTSWTYSSGSSGSLVVNISSNTGSTSTSTKAWYIYLGAYYYRYSGTQPAMGWTYTGSTGGVDTTTTFYKECMSSVGSTPGSSVFSKVYVTASSADATNYANWYSYYRARYLLMRTAVGRAFSTLDSGFRVGFTTISDTGISDGGTAYFRDVKDFDATQKSNFYASLYTAAPNSMTPLRAALSKVGRYFAKKVSSQTYDPMQYSCQRNFAILSTDGYWNSSAGYQLDGSTAIGNQDSSEPRPLFDGGVVVTNYSRIKYVVGLQGVRCSKWNTCSSTQYCVTETDQSKTSLDTTWAAGDVTAACRSGSYAVGNGSTASASAGTTVYSAETTSGGTAGGSSDSLSDVAEYYYKTDLRTPTLGNCSSTTSGATQDVCANSIPAAGRDTASWQHLTTYTVGLGVSGTLTYDKNYLTQTSGSYVDLTSGAVTWPVPASGSGAVNIDDLWHAAVNGRGQYYSALNASDLSEAIGGVVTSIQASTGAASAAATNTLDLVSGDNNSAYKASYTTVSWYGDIQAYSLNGTTATISSTPTWSAQTLLDNATPSARKIYFNKSGTLTSFLYDNLTTTQATYFDNLCSQAQVASQCPSLSTANLALANSGTNLVNYLRGVRTYEASNTASPLYRTRTHVLGDFINSSPVYVGAPSFSYTDTGYADFKTAQASRTAVLYAGANDGMLHAFNASTGAELWSYIPSAVMPNMYKLANKGYANSHAYFVDGTVAVGDIYVNNAWKTILVGGLGAGGRAYYALDITTPESPSLLWEFTDDNLGLSFGKPLIVKRADGTWVVAVTSGYNNTTGDGKGHLYILNANTGAKLLDISTGAGASATPSGLAHLNAWIASSTNNTALRFYGGDLLGNLWRFDIDNLVAPNQAALKLAEFQTSAGAAQPITVQPRLKLMSSTYPVVIVGTGRYLGTSDITDSNIQTVAAFKDPLTNTGLGVIRNSTTMVEKTLTASGTTATSTTGTVDWSTKNGWWFDLPTAGERIVTSMSLTASTLYAASAIPVGDACTSGGASWLYTINLTDGNSSGAQYSDSALIVGFTVTTTSNNESIVVIQDSTGKISTRDAGGGSTSGLGTPHRTSWRELFD